MKEKKPDMVTESMEALQMTCIAYAQNANLEVKDRLAYVEKACDIHEALLKTSQQRNDEKKSYIFAGATIISTVGYCIAAKYVDPFKMVTVAGKDALSGIRDFATKIGKAFIH